MYENNNSISNSSEKPILVLPYGHLDQICPTQGYNTKYEFVSQKMAVLSYAHNPDPTFHQQKGAVSPYYTALFTAGIALPNTAPEKRWCEVCKIFCDTQDVLDIHLTGKKHNKNVEKLRGPTNTDPCHVRNTNITPAHKKTKVPQWWCEVCKIRCDTKAVLDIHKSGKKHKENLEKLSGCPANTNPCRINTNGNHAGKKTKVVEWCEVCKIACDTKAVLKIHKSGKKHKENLEKLSGPTTSSPSVAIMPRPPVTPSYLPLPICNSSYIHKPINGPQEIPDRNLSRNARKTNKKKAADVEDLESKRIKVLRGGAAADAVRTCIYCNVVCNSETVFNYHIAGQKHAAMVNHFATSGGGSSVG